MTIKNELRKEIMNDFNINIDDYCPKNDLEAWIMYPNFNFLYNKLFICKIQNIQHAPMPILPNKYPIIIKPIINLMGMGINSIKINSKTEFLNHYNNNHFWSTFIKGTHLSWDLVINNGKILFCCRFKGYKDDNKFGTFNYWQLLKDKVNLPKPITNLVTTYLKDFTGCLNIETMNNKIIECHLRMGDIDQLPKDFLRQIFYNYINKETNFTNLKIKKDIFLIPIWQEIKSHHNLTLIYEYLESNWEKYIINSDYVNMYYFDQVKHAYPGKYKRWFLISTNNFLEANKIKNLIEKDLINYYS